ncbi:MAG: hypothetical protein PVF83_12505 [Anaerolineales bacterium]
MSKQTVIQTAVQFQSPSVSLDFLKSDLEPRAWQTLLNWLNQNDAPEIITKLVIDLSAVNYLSRVVAPENCGLLPPIENTTLPQITIELINAIYLIEAL